jgi:hypothetical protein
MNAAELARDLHGRNPLPQRLPKAMTDAGASAESLPTHSLEAASLPGPEPAGPDWHPIRAIHRHADGVITFHRKNVAGEFENLFGTSSKYLESMFPEIAEQLETDSYFSINAFFYPEKGRHYIPAAQARRSDNLRYLTAAFADVDSHKLGLDFGTAFGMILSAQEEGEILPPSIIVRSGRGLWLFWLLSDHHNPELPCRAFPEKVRVYVEVNRAIGERLAAMGADPAAHDALRLVRIPGSKNPRTKKVPNDLRVKFWLQCGVQGKPAVYTLNQLAEFFGAKLPKLDNSSKHALLEARRAPGDRLRGHAQLNARRLREFNLLWVARGGFPDGCRNHAALIYAWLLRRSGLDRASVTAHIERFAATCRPVLDMAARRDAVRTAFSRTISRMCDQTISDWLDITPAESKMLEKLPAASRFGVIDLHPKTDRSVNREQRRRLVAQLAAEFGVLPCRRMASLLAKRGHVVSYRSIARDYLALGLSEAKKFDA